MNSHDTNGRPYARLSELKAGDLVEVDMGFVCINPRVQHEVREGVEGLYIDCAQGEHWLEGQLDYSEDALDHLIGIYPVGLPYE